MSKKMIKAVRDWIDESPSTRNLSLIAHHIREMGLLRFIKKDFYAPDFYTYSDSLSNSYYELAKLIAQFSVSNSILDVGCGSGMLVQQLKKVMPEAMLRASDFHDGKALLKNGSDIDFFTWNLIEDFKPPEPADTVVCIEVVEHLPRKKIDTVLRNLSGVTRFRLILSAAKPGQWGDGHILCKPKSWWIERICATGFKYQEQLSNDLNTAVERNQTIMGEMAWINGNFMIFDKNA